MQGLLTTKFRKEVSKLKDFRMKSESEINVGYSTGFLNFDFLNGTVVHVEDKNASFNYYSVGIPDGCLVMLIGRSGCGKTTWAVQAAVNIVRNFENGVIFHDDIEGGLTEHRKKVLSGFTDEEIYNKFISRNVGITAENFYERVKMIHDMKLDDRENYLYDTGLYDSRGQRIFKLQPTVYILDSVALLMPEKFTEEEELSGSMSATAAAKTNSMSFKRIVPMLKSANIIMIMINHINKKIDINPMQRSKSQVSYLKQDESLPGGNTIIYLSNLLLKFDDGAKLKAEETFGVAGSLVELTIIKSRNNRAGQSCTLVFDQVRGFDPELSLFVMLKNAKLINGAGAYLYIGNHDEKKFSQKEFKNKLHNDPELKKIFMDAVMEYLKNDLDGRSFNSAGSEAFDYSIGADIIANLNSDITAA